MEFLLSYHEIYKHGVFEVVCIHYGLALALPFCGLALASVFPRCIYFSAHNPNYMKSYFQFNQYVSI
jgi:hypothetical protein